MAVGNAPKCFLLTAKQRQDEEEDEAEENEEEEEVELNTEARSEVPSLSDSSNIVFFLYLLTLKCCCDGVSCVSLAS